MPDSKISALPAGTTPPTGAEIIPLVQGGNTVSLTVAEIFEYVPDKMTLGAHVPSVVDPAFSANALRINQNDSNAVIIGVICAQPVGTEIYFENQDGAGTRIGSFSLGLNSSGNFQFQCGATCTIYNDIGSSTYADVNANSFTNPNSFFGLNADGSSYFAAGNVNIDTSGTLDVAGLNHLGSDGSGYLSANTITWDASGGNLTAASLTLTNSQLFSNGAADFVSLNAGFDVTNGRIYQKTPNGTKVYLHLTNPVAGTSVATWTTTP